MDCPFLFKIYLNHQFGGLPFVPRGSVHTHTGRLRPVVSRVDTSGGSVHLHTGRLRSGVTWGDTRIASAVLVPDFRVNPVPCIASAVLESSTVPTGWPRSYTVCGPTYPITGQKSEGESQWGIDMCVWLCFPAGCRLCAAPQRVCHLWSAVPTRSRRWHAAPILARIAPPA